MRNSFSYLHHYTKADVQNIKKSIKHFNWGKNSWIPFHIFKKVTVTEKKENSLFSVYDLVGVKLLTRLRLQLNCLNEHKLRHGLGDTVTLMYGCNADIEDTVSTSSCVAIFILFKDLSSSIILTKLTFLLNEQVNILSYGYPLNKFNALNQDIIKFFNSQYYKYWVILCAQRIVDLVLGKKIRVL